MTASRPQPILDRTVAVGAMLILALSANQFSFELAPKAYLSIVDPVVGIVFVLWLVQQVRARTLHSCLRLPIFTVLFLVACACSALRAGNLLNTAKDLFQFGEYFVAAFLVFSTVLDQVRNRRWMLDVFLATTAVVLAAATVQYVRSDVVDFDVRGLFGNANVLGGFVALSVPLAFSLLLGGASPLKRAWGAVVVLAAAVVTLSGAAFAAVTAVCIGLAARRGTRAAVITVIAAAALCTAVLPHLPRMNPDAHYASVGCFSDEGEPRGRYPEWQAATIMAMENPWLGVGLGNYQTNVGMYYGMLPSPNRATQPDTQNLYLVLASSIGIPGMLAFVGLLACGIAAAGRRIAGPGGAQAAGAVAALVAFAVTAFWSPLLVRGIGIPLAFVLALAFRRDTRDAASAADTPR